MHQSTATRELVLQFLYSCDLAKMNLFIPGIWRQFVESFKTRKISARKARLYIKTIFDHTADIDAMIIPYLKEGWDINRISRVDLILIRIFVAENYIFHTPKNVIFNEIINIAKKYGGEESSKFVNGICQEIDLNEIRVS